MNSQTKLGCWAIFILILMIIISHRFGDKNRVSGISLHMPKLAWSQTLKFSFEKEESLGLKTVVDQSLQGQSGTWAVYIEELSASPSATEKQDINLEKYSRLDDISFPAASLYKLVLLSAVLKEVEQDRIDEGETIASTKTHLKEVYGGIDFGYEDAPEKINYTIREAMSRVGRISDNFAAIMLTDRLSQLPHKDGENGLLYQMVSELGMTHTDFSTDPIQTNAQDVGTFFKRLNNGQVVSQKTSDGLAGLLSLSRINDRLPAKLPADVKVIHKTGELSRVRHDAGIIYPTAGNPYVLVVLSKDLSHEDDGVDAIAQLSKDVYEYFQTK